tara:strand:- start:4180 stop:4536 length:357 start_codon:yes stop_codon:yes gene_type:complete
MILSIETFGKYYSGSDELPGDYIGSSETHRFDLEKVNWKRLAEEQLTKNQYNLYLELMEPAKKARDKKLADIKQEYEDTVLDNSDSTNPFGRSPFATYLHNKNISEQVTYASFSLCRL